MLKALRYSLALTASLIAEPCFAWTECTVSLSDVFSGDGGYIWFHYTNGGSSYVIPTDPNKTAMTALATTGLVTGRQLIIRYNADGVACTTSGRSDVIGLYLK